MATIRTYTTIEQSNKLLELGLNPKSADLEYKCVGFTMHTNGPTDNLKYKVMLKEQSIPHEQEYDTPCWSVGALINLMPPFISKLDITYNFRCDKDNAQYYIISYERISRITKIGISIAVIYEKLFVDSCFKMVVWLLENNYLKEGK